MPERLELFVVDKKARAGRHQKPRREFLGRELEERLMVAQQEV